MLDRIKQLFCRHEYKIIQDYVNILSPGAKDHKCHKCLKIKKIRY